ncbi:hypothetical protein, partial [Enterococcus lactis]|uniref:hypothetical protein n=1 Tax=Enterococcus lactis TaxID=357441 RepID=UPI0034E93CE5
AATAAALYQKQFNTQADWALAYGLKVVAYEGGWGLGGDDGGSPLQNYGKYVDSGGVQDNLNMLTGFAQSGSDLQLFGTYDVLGVFGVKNLTPDFY